MVRRLSFLSAMVVATVAAIAPAAWANGCGVPFSGTTYTIGTEAELRLFSTASSPACDKSWNVDITADITMDTGTALAPAGGAFSGTFDGKGHTISFLRIRRVGAGNAGLFEQIVGGTVKNLTLSDVQVPGGADVGALAGTAQNAVITDVNVVDGVIGGTGYVGGVIGKLDGTSLAARLSTSGIVTTTGIAAGGVLGGVDATAGNAITLAGLQSTASATSTGGDDSTAGGVIGVAWATGDLSISQLLASGAVYGYARVGGLIGQATSQSGGTFTLSGAKATGDATGSDGVGGLIGLAALDTCTPACTMRISSVAARGDVVGRSGNVGGLIGTFDVETLGGSPPCSGCVGELTDAYSTGRVTATPPSKTGGLIGRVESNATSTITLTRAYSASTVGTAGAGLVGTAINASATASFWNPTDAGATSSALGTESTSSAMRTLAPYTDAKWPIIAGWTAPSATAVWGSCAGLQDGLPFLLAEYTTDPCPAPVPPTPTPKTRGTLAVSSTTVGRTSFSLRVRVNGAGRLTLVGTRPGRSTRASAKRVCATTSKVSKAGTVTVTCVLNAATIRALRLRAITVRWRAVFTPTGGLAGRTTGSVMFARLGPVRPQPVTG